MCRIGLPHDSRQLEGFAGSTCTGSLLTVGVMVSCLTTAWSADRFPITPTVLPELDGVDGGTFTTGSLATEPLVSKLEADVDLSFDAGRMGLRTGGELSTTTIFSLTVLTVLVSVWTGGKTGMT